eukprot:4231243-Pyramimonas_sp.AAC.1
MLRATIRMCRFRAELPLERRARKRRQAAMRGGEGSESEAEEEDTGGVEDDEYEEEEEMIYASARSAGGLLKGSAVGGKLPAGELQVSRLKDANQVRGIWVYSRSGRGAS